VPFIYILGGAIFSCIYLDELHLKLTISSELIIFYFLKLEHWQSSSNAEDEWHHECDERQLSSPPPSLQRTNRAGDHESSPAGNEGLSPRALPSPPSVPQPSDAHRTASSASFFFHTLISQSRYLSLAPSSFARCPEFHRL